MSAAFFFGSAALSLHHLNSKRHYAGWCARGEEGCQTKVKLTVACLITRLVRTDLDPEMTREQRRCIDDCFCGFGDKTSGIMFSGRTRTRSATPTYSSSCFACTCAARMEVLA